MRLLLNGVLVLLLVTYPVVVYFGLQYLEPRAIGFMLLGVLVFRALLSIDRLGEMQALFPMLAGVGLALAVSLFNSDLLLKFYPVVISLVFLVVFAWTLASPPSMIERFARLQEPDLDESAVRYTRQVTMVWCGFFLFNAFVATITTFLDFSLWALYNGCISYLLMGLLFAVEWIVRQKVKQRGAKN